MFAVPFAIDCLWKVTFLLAFAATLDLALPRSSAAIRHRLWSITCAAMIVLPFLVWCLPQFRIPIGSVLSGRSVPTVVDLQNRNSQRDSPQPFHARDAATLPTILPPVPLASDVSQFHVNSQVLGDSEIHATENTLNSAGASSVQPTTILERLLTFVRSGSLFQETSGVWLGCIWLLGCTIVLFPLFLGIRTNHKLRRQARAVQDPALIDAVQAECRRLGIDRRVEVIETVLPVVPMTWGIFRPVILLPSVWRGWGQESWRVVLLHELAHIQRWDVLYQSLCRIACAVYWFHPMVWYAQRRLRVERELACDDCVIMAGQRPSSYAEQLVTIARSYTRFAIPPAMAMAHRTGLEQRIRALLDQARSRVRTMEQRDLCSWPARTCAVAYMASIPT
ncbi:MAG: M56 family metallopeptidase [Pirellula sp.]